MLRIDRAVPTQYVYADFPSGKTLRETFFEVVVVVKKKKKIKPIEKSDEPTAVHRLGLIISGLTRSRVKING